jgi:hypothetical protein
MFHWQDATKDQCRGFYAYVKRYVQDRALVWKQFLDDAYEEMSEAKDGKRPSASDGDRHSFSKGELSRVKINLVWRWLEKHEPDYVTTIEANLGLPFDGLDAQGNPTSLPKRSKPKPDEPQRPRVTWRQFLDDHAIPHRVDVRLIKPRPEPEPPDPVQERPETSIPKPSPIIGEAGIQASVAPPDRWPLSKTTVRLGEEFYFAFTPVVSGSILALQRTGYPWWEPLPINGHDSFIDTDRSFDHLPHDDMGNGIPLVENERAAPHDFVFLKAPMTLLSPTIEAIGGAWQVESMALDYLARRLDQTEDHWTLMRLRVTFRA